MFTKPFNLNTKVHFCRPKLPHSLSTLMTISGNCVDINIFDINIVPVFLDQTNQNCKICTKYNNHWYVANGDNVLLPLKIIIFILCNKNCENTNFVFIPIKKSVTKTIYCEEGIYDNKPYIFTNRNVLHCEPLHNEPKGRKKINLLARIWSRAVNRRFEAHCIM